MKKIEMYLENFLLSLFFYSLVVFILTLDASAQGNLIIDNLKSTHLMIFSMEENVILSNLIYVNPLIIIIGFLLSAFAMEFFPLWDFDSYFKDIPRKKINKYRFIYKKNYLKLLIGFIYLIILYIFILLLKWGFVSNEIFYDTSVIFLLLFILFFKFKFYKKKEKIDIINNELRIEKYFHQKISKIRYL